MADYLECPIFFMFASKKAATCHKQHIWYQSAWFQEIFVFFNYPASGQLENHYRSSKADV